MAVGRISGPLLKDNLLRDGVNLAFETDLLFLDVVNGRVGIKTATPTNELSVNGTTKTTNLQVVTQADIATFTISGSDIASSSGTINLVPSGTNAVVYQSKISVNSDLQITTNTIETTVTNSDLAINTVGTGQVNVNANMLVNGDLHATGTITADGSIIIGDTNTDNITINADVNSNIIPDTTNFYDLGSNPSTDGKEWANVYAHNIYSTNLTASSATVNGINLTLAQGNTYYVATTGSDSASGTRENDPFLTVKHALAVATSGTTVYIYPGTYTEIFPLTIPVGVTVRGSGVRAVTIQPTVGTISKDAFLLNGETTVEDLTLTGFRFNGTDNTGYGFRFDNNFLVTTRSPYIRNVTVITKGSTTSSGDPYGFDSNDAGKGILADGSVANALSKEASMLFHSVTFITPNQETITATNGVRIEWLNSFTYFADKGLYAYSSSAGFAGAGLTRLRIDTRTGTWAVGNTVTYYDTNGTTVLATGTIASVDGNYVNLTGKCIGFQTITDRAGKTLYAQGNAKLSTTQKKFGTASLALDGSTDYVTVPTTTDFGFGTGNFTIEAWVYRTASNGSNQEIFDFRTTSAQVVPLLYLSVGGIPIYAVNTVSVITGSAAISNNTWTHIAVSKSGNSTKLFVNGVQSGSTYTDNNTYLSTAPLQIGARYDGVASFLGYIDDVKISKGVARYTTTFTAPTSALTGDNSTVLLLHFNGANNSTTFIDDGVTYQDLRTSAGGRATLINFADYSDFGAEIRAIGSANIYGNYGAYGDGIGVIAYLISQNFAYVGSGKVSTNDPNDRIDANEITQLNGAKIYYTSVDNEGNFSVGNYFSINQKTGEVSFNGTLTSITATSGVTFTDGTNTTTILPGEIDTGNIKISGNTIESITGNVNVTAASGAINLQNNTFITGNLDVTGNVTIGGNITIGDATTDTINFVAGIDSNLVPATNAFYDLGTSSLRWANVFLSRAEIDGLVIDSNTISTTVGNDNLTLSANGTGKINIPNNNVLLGQDLTVDGTTNLKGTTITGDVTQSGNVTQTGDYTQTGNMGITGNLTVSSYGQFEKIRIDGNVISTTATNTDLKLEAAGTGRIYVPSDDVQIDQNLTVLGTTTTGNLSVTNTLTASALDDGDILIENNEITTTITNHNLILNANGAGIISIPTNDVQIDQNLTVNGDTDLQATTINGWLTQTGNVLQTGDYTQTGDTGITGNLTVSSFAQFQNIRIDSNEISTTITDTDLQLEAAGTGRIYVPSSDVLIDQNLTVNGTATINSLGVTTTITSDSISDGDILIENNTITTQLTDSNLELSANGAGIVLVPTNNVELDQQLTVNGDTTLKATTINGNITQTGDVTQTGDYTQTGDMTITGNLTVSTYGQFEKIRIDGNVLSTTATDTDLLLEADGAGKIYVPNDDVLIDNNLTVNGTATINNLSVTTTITADSLSDGDILIENNSISTQTTDSDLELSANGTGIVLIPTNDVQIDNNLTVNGDTTLKATTINGNITHTGNVTQTGDYTQTGDTTITGNLTVSTFGQFEKIRVDSNTISTTTTNTDLELSANGTGRIYIPSNNVQINQNLTVNGTATIDTLSVTNGITADSLSDGDILIENNTITTQLTDSNLELKANGTGIISIPTNNVEITQDLTVVGNLTVTTGTTYLNDTTVTGSITQTGDIHQTGDFTTTGNTEVTGNVTATGDIDLAEISIIANTISTKTSGTDLQLQANGTGNVVFEGLKVSDNTILSTATNSDITLTPQGTGSVIISSNQSLVIPVGGNSDRPASPTNGMIRFNTDLDRYEGYSATYETWVQLSGVEDADGNTYITAEATPGTNDNVLRFYVDSSLMAYIDATKLWATRIETDQLAIYDNQITTVATDTDINLTTTGTGGVKVGNLKVRNNTITNTVSGAVTEFAETGTGYVKIAGTNGVVIPAGDLTQLPATPELGMIRFNTYYGYVEIFNGLTWVNVAGSTSGISLSQAQDIGIVSALLFG